MIATLLLLFVGGIGLTQAVSDPKQVTLRWLRLGGLISLALLAVAVTLTFLQHNGNIDPLLWIAAAMVIGQLMTVQLGKRSAQRAFAMLVFLTAVRPTDFANTLTAYLAAGLLGGYLMSMLLGHAYLTAGNEMTQQPFARVIGMLAILLVLRAALSAAVGAWPYFHMDHSDETMRRPQTWNMMMIAARYMVGILIPGIFTWMVYDCVKRRSNQSATGILYVAGVLIIIGEGAAIALRNAPDMAGFLF